MCVWVNYASAWISCPHWLPPAFLLQPVWSHWGCQVCPEEHYTMLRTTMNVVQGCSSLLHLSPASLHVNLLCPADRTAGPLPHPLENNCYLMMAAVLLLQKEAQTFLWESSARGYFAKGICFYFYRHRQRLPATAVVLSIICKRKCLPSNDHHGQQTVEPEICNLSLVWIRNFIEHAIKEKTTSEEYRRFHPTCRTSWERGNVFLWHLQVLHQFPVINCLWFLQTYHKSMDTTVQAPELVLLFSVLLKHLPLTCRLQICSSSSLEWVCLDSFCHLMLGQQHRILLQTKTRKGYFAHQTCLCILTESGQRFYIQSWTSENSLAGNTGTRLQNTENPGTIIFYK